MRIRCIANTLTEEQRGLLGFPAWQNPLFQITPGREYTVLGVTATPNYISGAVVQLANDASVCIFVPICLFEITDPRPSRYWRAELYNIHTLRLWPSEFLKEYFHDDLSDGINGTREVFLEVEKKLSHEFSD